jgi:hypothetical protein
MRRSRTQRRNRRLLALAAFVVAGLVVAVGPCREAAPNHEPVRRPNIVPTPSVRGENDEIDGEAVGPGPRSSVGGVGVGFEYSERGALAAALSYATAAQSWLYLGDDQLVVAANAVVAPSARDRLVGSLVDDVRLLRDQLDEATGVVWYVVSPLATKVDSYRASRAVVRVWTVRILSADGVAVPQSGWSTLSFELVWDSDDWRVADVAEADGPSPQLEAGAQPWAASYVDETLAGFTRVGVAP